MSHAPDLTDQHQKLRRRHGHRLLRSLTVIALAALGGACAVPAPASGGTMPARQAVSVAGARNVAYGPHGAHRLDIHPPTAGGNRGVIITVHGGGFFSGDRREVPATFGPVTAQQRRGYAIVNISYRLQGRHGAQPFPNAVADVALAVDWVRANGAAHGLNPRTIITAGHSSGATLVALAATGHNSADRHRLGRTAKVDGWIAVAGMYDFTVPTNRTVAALSTTWIQPATNRAAASTVRHLDRADPPGYIVHGANDSVVPVSQAHALLGRAAQVSSGGRLYYDIVTSGPAACRGHSPHCGMNAGIVNHWVDQIDRRTL